jgi:hypothetical protein
MDVIGAKSASNFGKPERIAKEEKKPIKKAPYTGAFPLLSRIQVRLRSAVQEVDHQTEHQPR